MKELFSKENKSYEYYLEACKIVDKVNTYVDNGDLVIGLGRGRLSKMTQMGELAISLNYDNISSMYIGSTFDVKNKIFIYKKELEDFKTEMRSLKVVKQKDIQFINI